MQRLALVTMALLSPLILVASVLGGPVGETIFALAAVLFPAAICARAARSSAGRLLAAALVVMLLSMAVGLLTIDPAGPPRAGLPMATWWMLIAGGLAPLILITLGYAAVYRRERSAGPPGKPPPPGMVL